MLHHHHIDLLANQSTWLHRRDSRGKLLVTILFTVFVVQAPPAALGLLCLYAVGPYSLLMMTGTPWRLVARQTLWVSPFVVVLALSCLWFDRQPAVLPLGPWQWDLTAGALRGIAILIKFVITMGALLALVSTTPFHRLLTGLQGLYMPSALVTQLGFLYRYLFVLAESAQQMWQARQMRHHRRLGVVRESRIMVSMVSSLLARTLVRSEHISRAMQARGFTGHWSHTGELHWDKKDTLFLLASVIVLTAIHLGLTPLMTPGVMS